MQDTDTSFRQQFWKLVDRHLRVPLKIYLATGCVAEKELQAPQFAFIDFRPDPDAIIEKIFT